jgi:ABC-type uncharacterized transport system substrate-binding protein
MTVRFCVRETDVLLAPGGTVTGALQRATHEIPIVFVETTDPVDRGLVASLSKPGGNITGFTQFDFANQRQMAGTAQSGCAWHRARGGYSRPRAVFRGC